MSKLWKRNAIVAAVLLFVCAGIYLNWSYNKNKSGTELADTLDTAALASAAVDAVDAVADEVETVASASPEASAAAADALSVDAVLGDVETVTDGNQYDALLTEATTDTTMSDYFANIRMAREEARDSAVTLLQETISYETGDDGDGTAATTASVQLEDLVSTALSEAEIEGQIIAKGYEDCVAFMEDGSISVAVAAPAEGLSPENVAQICDIVTTGSDYSAAQLKIIEVK